MNNKTIKTAVSDEITHQVIHTAMHAIGRGVSIPVHIVKIGGEFESCLYEQKKQLIDHGNFSQKNIGSAENYCMVHTIVDEGVHLITHKNVVMRFLGNVYKPNNTKPYNEIYDVNSKPNTSGFVNNMINYRNLMGFYIVDRPVHFMYEHTFGVVEKLSDFIVDKSAKMIENISWNDVQNALDNAIHANVAIENGYITPFSAEQQVKTWQKTMNKPMNTAPVELVSDEIITTATNQPVELVSGEVEVKTVDLPVITRKDVLMFLSKMIDFALLMDNWRNMNDGERIRQIIGHVIQFKDEFSLNLISKALISHKLNVEDVCSIALTSYVPELGQVISSFMNLLTGLRKGKHIKSSAVSFSIALASLEIPVVGEIYMFYGISQNVLQLLTRTKEVDINGIFATKIARPGMSHWKIVQICEYHNDLLDIHVSSHASHASSAERKAREKFNHESSEKIYPVMGISHYFINPDRDTNLNRNDKMREQILFNTLSENWADSKKLSPREKQIYFAHITGKNGLDGNTFFARHQNESIWNFSVNAYNYYVHGQENIGKIDDVQNAYVELVKNHRGDRITRGGEEVQLQMYQNHQGKYSDWNVFAVGNEMVWEQNISTLSLYQTGVSSIEGTILRMIVYFDQEIQNFKYFGFRQIGSGKVKYILSSFSQSHLTRVLSSHTIFSVGFYCPEICDDTLNNIIAPNIGIISSAMVGTAYFAFSGRFGKMNSGEKVYSLLENSLTTNAGIVNDYLCNWSFFSDLSVDKTIAYTKKCAMIKTGMAKLFEQKLVGMGLGKIAINGILFSTSYIPVLITMIISRLVNQMIFGKKVDFNYLEMVHHDDVQNKLCIIEKAQKVLDNYDNIPDCDKLVLVNYLEKEKIIQEPVPEIVKCEYHHSIPEDSFGMDL